MIKRRLLLLLNIVVFVGSVFSGEWDYVPNVEMQYMGNCNETQFRSAGNFNENGFHQISKLPKEVSQAIQEELKSYDLDIGDWFTFSCGWEWTTPKAIRVALRITNINSNGSYNYVFYAWQMY
jgi:hypothetical protein